MTDTPPGMRFGLLPSPQFTSWEAMRDVGVLADEVGYHSLWCSDHLYAPYPWTGPGPAYEAYMILAGWAATTFRVELGAMVTAFSFRDPALLVKMVTTLDHISAGRAVLAVGAGWFETEHRAFGFDFEAPGERVSRFGEAVRLMRAMLDGETPSGERFYRHEEVHNLPAPVRDRVPLLIGGRGDRMLRLVAQHADAWNLAGLLDDVREKDATLRRLCDEVGRDESEIERTFHGGPVFLRDTVAEAEALAERLFAHHGIVGAQPTLVGPPELIAERLAAFAALGFRHMYFDAHSPYDEESVTRLITDVLPLLD